MLAKSKIINLPEKLLASLQRYRYADVIADLDGIDHWLHGLGLQAKQDRIHFAINILHRAEQNFQKRGAKGWPPEDGNVQDYIFGVCEALEIRDIYKAFRDEPRERIAPILTRALSGPHRPIDENERNSEGRNIAFELALGADLRLRGAKIELQEPDLKLSIEDNQYFIACKRPLRSDSISACIRAAARQLRENLKGAGHHTYGIIAISVGRILNPGTHYFAAHLEALGDRVEQLLVENMRHSQNATRNVPIVCAVLFHIGTPGELGDYLVRMSYSALYDAGVPSPSFEGLARVIGPMYDNE